MQPEKTSVLVPRLSRTKLFDRDVVRGVITEAVQALGYRLPTREQLLVTEQFVSGRDVFVSLPTGSGKSVCYGCLPLVFDKLRDDGDHHSICRTGIRNETAYWSHDNHALRHSMFAIRPRRGRPDSLFGRVHVRVWVRDYFLPSSSADERPRACKCYLPRFRLLQSSLLPLTLQSFSNHRLVLQMQSFSLVLPVSHGCEHSQFTITSLEQSLIPGFRAARKHGRPGPPCPCKTQARVRIRTWAIA